MSMSSPLSMWSQTKHWWKCATYSSKCPIFLFFVYLYYPMKFERKFLMGPPLAHPVLKNKAPPPPEKKLDPLPWALGARPRMIQTFPSNWSIVFFMSKGMLEVGRKNLNSPDCLRREEKKCNINLRFLIADRHNRLVCRCCNNLCRFTNKIFSWFFQLTV